jgi:hypothetical protein
MIITLMNSGKINCFNKNVLIDDNVNKVKI